MRPLLAALLLGTAILAGCSFRAGVNDSRAALDRGAPDEALRILGELELERAGRRPALLARYDFVRGAALYEIGRQEEARSALHGALAADLRAGGALPRDDRARLATLLTELDTGRAKRSAKGDGDGDGAKGDPAAREKTDKGDKTDKDKDKPDKDKPDPDMKDPKDAKDDKGKPAKSPLPVAISCSGAVNTPSGIYGGYMVALNAKDAACVLAHTTKEFSAKYGEMLEFAITMVASAEGKVLDEKIDGGAATLKVHEKIVISVEGMETTSERDKTLKLVIEEGTWKLEALDEGAEDDHGDDSGWDEGDYPDDDPDDPGDDEIGERRVR